MSLTGNHDLDSLITAIDYLRRCHTERAIEFHPLFSEHTASCNPIDLVLAAAAPFIGDASDDYIPTDPALLPAGYRATHPEGTDRTIVVKDPP